MTKKTDLVSTVGLQCMKGATGYVALCMPCMPIMQANNFHVRLPAISKYLKVNTSGVFFEFYFPYNRIRIHWQDDLIVNNCFQVLKSTRK